MAINNMRILICSDGGMAIAFTVFVMLTVLLTVFIILLFVNKPFRKFLFRKDYEQSESPEREINVHERFAPEQDVNFDIEPIYSDRQNVRKDKDEQFADPVPTVPLELTTEPDQKTTIIEKRETRRRTTTLDNIRTVEIPETKPYQMSRETDRSRFITSTPRTNAQPRSDGEQAARHAPPRRSAMTKYSTNKDDGDGE